MIDSMRDNFAWKQRNIIFDFWHTFQNIFTIKTTNFKVMTYKNIWKGFWESLSLGTLPTGCIFQLPAFIGWKTAFGKEMKAKRQNVSNSWSLAPIQNSHKNCFLAWPWSKYNIWGPHRERKQIVHSQSLCISRCSINDIRIKLWLSPASLSRFHL